MHLDRQVHDVHCSFVPGLSGPDSGESGCQVTLISPYSSVFRSSLWGGVPISLPAMGVFAFLLFFAVEVVLSGRQRDPRATGFLALATALRKITKIRITAESLLAALQDSCSAVPAALRCVNEHKSTVHCDPQKLLRALTRMIESVAGGSHPASGPVSGPIVGPVSGLVAGPASDHNPRVVEVRAALDGNDSILAVRAHGFEVPYDVRVRIFEPFAMHNRAGSRGLGLAIVRSIVRAHGGDIAVLGEGAGSSFVIRLPGAGEPGRAQDRRFL
jgi:hypothetical protein